MDANIKAIQQKANSQVASVKADAARELERKQKNLVTTYSTEERVDVSIAPMYAAEFGNKMRVSVNCISVTIPCDGRHYKVPVTFATEINRRISAVNRRLAREKRAVDPVYETSPGEISII